MKLKRRGKVWVLDWYTPAGDRERQSLKTESKPKAEMLAARYIAEWPSPLRQQSVLPSATADAQPTASRTTTATRATSRNAGAGALAGPTLDQAFRAAMDSRAKWRDAKRQDSLETTYASVIAHFGKDRAVSSITEADITAWMQAMALEHGKRKGTMLSPSTINHRLSLLSVLMKQARVPVPYFERRVVRKGRQKVYAPTEFDGIHQWFLSSPSKGSKDMADLVLVLMDTAARISEGLRMNDRDIDLEGGMVAIWENKADHPRTVPLTERVKAILKARRGRAGGLPFGGLTLDRCEDLWRQCRRALKMEGDLQFVPHAIRHTSLTRIASVHPDAMKLKQFAGHKSLMTTQQYIHMDAEALRPLLSAFQRSDQPAAVKAVYRDHDEQPGEAA